MCGAEGYELRKLRFQVGLVFQYPEHQLFESDVMSDVCFGPSNEGLTQEECRKRAKEALDHVGIPEEYYDKSPFELSGGEKASGGHRRSAGHESQGAGTG